MKLSEKSLDALDAFVKCFVEDVNAPHLMNRVRMDLEITYQMGGDPCDCCNQGDDRLILWNRTRVYPDLQRDQEENG